MSEIAKNIEKSCKELDSTSTAFHIKECKLLLKNVDNGSDESITCESLLERIELGQEKLQSIHGSGKSKGKQKSAKLAPPSGSVKLKVWGFTFVIYRPV